MGLDSGVKETHARGQVAPALRYREPLDDYPPQPNERSVILLFALPLRPCRNLSNIHGALLRRQQAGLPYSDESFYTPFTVVRPRLRRDHRRGGYG